MVTGSFPGGKRPGTGVGHRPYLAQRLKEEYSATSPPPPLWAFVASSRMKFNFPVIFILRTFSRRTSWYSLVNSRAVQFLLPHYTKRNASRYTILLVLYSPLVSVAEVTQQIPLCHWQFKMNDYVYLNISKLQLLYSLASDLFNELSFKLISTGNSCDSLGAQSCCYKSNHMKTFDRILFRRSAATNHSGIK